MFPNDMTTEIIKLTGPEIWRHAGLEPFDIHELQDPRGVGFLAVENDNIPGRIGIARSKSS